MCIVLLPGGVVLHGHASCHLWSWLCCGMSALKTFRSMQTAFPFWPIASWMWVVLSSEDIVVVTMYTSLTAVCSCYLINSGTWMLVTLPRLGYNSGLLVFLIGHIAGPDFRYRCDGRGVRTRGVTWWMGWQSVEWRSQRSGLSLGHHSGDSGRRWSGQRSSCTDRC